MFFPVLLVADAPLLSIVPAEGSGRTNTASPPPRQCARRKGGSDRPPHLMSGSTSN
jgi:hypothetical protein